MYFEEVERVALKDAQPILRWTVELVLSGLLGGALWSCVLACCAWVSARAKSLLLSNDQPYAVGTDATFTYSLQLWVPLGQEWLKCCV